MHVIMHVLIMEVLKLTLVCDVSCCTAIVVLS